MRLRNLMILKVVIDLKRIRDGNPNTTTGGHSVFDLRTALAKSSNTIAVKVAETLGDTYDECVDIMIDQLKDFGIHSIKRKIQKKVRMIENSHH